MKRPKKMKKIRGILCEQNIGAEYWNDCRKKYKAFLPNEEEIEGIINDFFERTTLKCQSPSRMMVKYLANDIYTRIRAEKVTSTKD